jgi:hypothetical protein
MIHHIDRLSSLSVCCLAWSFASTRAFSTPLNTQRLGAAPVAATSASTTSLSTTRRLSQLNVASTPTIAVADMERGVLLVQFLRHHGKHESSHCMEMDAAATVLKGPGTSTPFHSFLCVHGHGVEPTQSLSAPISFWNHAQQPLEDNGKESIYCNGKNDFNGTGAGATGVARDNRC